ncbi:MAG: endonuclease/exonuclease/phosphatase family protein [Acidimicrobiales bacterium]|nr:endonuclease/exonuclease/phosphatase family protein [Acidimicrobiales bacterium]
MARAGAVELRCCFYNAFLLRAARVPLPGRARYLHSAPAVDARSRELGRRLAGRYDVAALCEVFDQSEHRALVSGWHGRGGRHGRPRTAAGPPVLLRRVPLVKTSGLLTVVDGHAVARTATHLYRTRGHRFLDADAWAHKGALLVEVDVGLAANLEVYSTHLIWGGDLLVPRERHHRSAVADFRQAQAHELLDFVRRTHRPGNATLVVGDFNIDALHPSSAYTDLTGAMGDAGFDDLWLTHGTGPGWTCDLRKAPEVIAVADPDDPDRCLDRASREDQAQADAPPEDGNEPGKRIDFAWLRRPTGEDGVAVEVRAVRRLAFPREPGVPGYDELPFLSDHLGLHLELALR